MGKVSRVLGANPSPAILEIFMTKNQPILERFMEKVKVQENGCWAFTSSIGQSGNGRFFFMGRCVDAYKLLYELLVGPVLYSQELHHICKDRSCVNPEHLVPVTRAEHRLLHLKSHCMHGHALTEDNLVPSLLPKRSCLVCARKRSRDCQRRKKSLEMENRNELT